MSSLRVVFDTNVLISATLLENSVPDQALARAELHGVVLYSLATFTELSAVLSRPKFSRYLIAEKSDRFLTRIHHTWELVHIIHQVQVCRDPKDDMFLDLAISGEADILVTGDEDLLMLSPYRGITILTAADFIKRHATTS